MPSVQSRHGGKLLGPRFGLTAQYCEHGPATGESTSGLASAVVACIRSPRIFTPRILGGVRVLPLGYAHGASTSNARLIRMEGTQDPPQVVGLHLFHAQADGVNLRATGTGKWNSV